jgi:hypothetical protein
MKKEEGVITYYGSFMEDKRPPSIYQQRLEAVQAYERDVFTYNQKERETLRRVCIICAFNIRSNQPPLGNVCNQCRFAYDIVPRRNRIPCSVCLTEPVQCFGKKKRRFAAPVCVAKECWLAYRKRLVDSCIASILALRQLGIHRDVLRLIVRIVFPVFPLPPIYVPPPAPVPTEIVLEEMEKLKFDFKKFQFT